MMSGPKQLFLKYHRAIVGVTWLAWFVSPQIIVGNLNLLRRQAWMPNEISQLLMALFETIWPIGFVAVSMILAADTIIDWSNDATKAQSDYELSRTNRTPPN